MFNQDTNPPVALNDGMCNYVKFKIKICWFRCNLYIYNVVS